MCFGDNDLFDKNQQQQHMPRLSISRFNYICMLFRVHCYTSIYSVSWIATLPACARRLLHQVKIYPVRPRKKKKWSTTITARVQLQSMIISSRPFQEALLLRKGAQTLWPTDKCSELKKKMEVQLLLHIDLGFCGKSFCRHCPMLRC